jgi:hypothetical protein
MGIQANSMWFNIKSYDRRSSKYMHFSLNIWDFIPAADTLRIVQLFKNIKQYYYQEYYRLGCDTV